MTSREVLIEEASSRDASALVDFLARVTKETDLIYKEGPSLDVEQMAIFLNQSAESLGCLCLLAKIDENVVGLVNVVEESGAIGDVFLAVHQDYRGQGLGNLLMEVMIDWALENGILAGLRLTVQARNTVALHLYKKFGFEYDRLLKKAILSKEGLPLDVYQMSMQLSKE